MFKARRMPIYNYLDLSTAHIKEKTFKWLEAQIGKETPPVIVYRKDCGLFLCVPPDMTEEWKVPDDLRYCLWCAYKYNCNWIIFDADAPVIDDLVQYEW